jgi:isopentenyldiphosphate isomerase
MPEMLDIYDEDLVHIGVKEREAVHQDGDWHRTFHCWIIFRGQDGHDFVVMQKRAPGKQFFPNMLDITVAGHYEAGETIQDGIREIREELGIEVDFAKLIPVGIRLSVAKQNGLVDYEYNEVFFLIDDRPLESYELQEDEVSGLVCFDIDEGLALLFGECDSIVVQAVGLGSDEVEIRREDFILKPDHYNERVLMLAKSCLNNEKYLVI